MALLVTLLAGCTLGPSAQASPAADPSVWTELAQVRTLEARFVQVQHRAILKTPLESSGRVTFTRPSSLSWVVERPAASTFSLAGTVATMDMPDVGLHEVFDLAAVPDASRLATSLMVWMQADPAAVARDFDTTWRQSPPGVVLRPKDSRLASLVTTLTLDLTPSPWRVQAVHYVEPDGDRVDIRFVSVVLDGTALPDPAP